MDEPSYHTAMFPWFAFGHLIPYLQLSNRLAERGHRISFFVPRRAQAKLQHGNLYPDLITFVPVTVPQVEGLPDCAETTADVPKSVPILASAFDQTESDVQVLLSQLKPDYVFFDFAHWMPSLTKRLGIKCIQYHIVSAPTMGRHLSHARHYGIQSELTDEILRQPPPGYPEQSAVLTLHEAREFEMRRKLVFGSGVFLFERLLAGMTQSDAVAFRSCRELDGPILDYIQTQFGKPLLPTGPVLPNFSTSDLDQKLASWLGGFQAAGSVIYCAFGSETVLPEDQFHELLLGFEQTGMPFFVVCKLPCGVSIEEAVPEGFLQRIEGRGILHDGWVPQQKILQHPSIGCFVSHCGYSSLLEALPNRCQLVLIPLIDHVNAKRMSSTLKLAVEVERGEEDGFFTKDGVCKAIKTVMDENCEAGKEIRANRAKLREIFLNDKFESFYIDNVCKMFQDLKG